MTWIAFLLSAVLVALVGVVLLVTPAVVSTTLPLGVSVPAERAHEPVIRAAVRGYRRGVVAALVLSLLTAWLLAAAAPAVGTIVPVFVMLLLGYAAYATSRNRIRRAKRREGWYDDVPMRLTLDVTGASRVPVGPGWYLAALTVLAVVAGIGVALYPTFPNPMPIHWNAAGHIDRYADKSIWSVFGPLMIGAAIVILLFVFALRAHLTPPRVRAGGPPDVVADLARVQLHLTQSLVGQLSVALALVLGGISLIGWLAPTSGATALVAGVGTVGLVAVLVVLYLVRYRSEMRAITTRDSQRRQPATGARPADARVSAPDDDRFWKLAVFYVNRHDPATMVPKRFGVGWTINLGSPGGMTIGILVGLLIAGGAVAGFVVPGHRLG